MTAATTAIAPSGVLPSLTRRARPQLLVTAGQAIAGAGNLLFALIAAHMLVPRAYADLVAFLALYLLLHLPAMSLSAVGAVDPAAVARARRYCGAGGICLGGALAALSQPLADVLDVAPAMILCLAIAAPGACLLGLERGRLYGSTRHGSVVATLLAEPAARLSFGAALAVVAGATGAAAGVVAGGYIALAAALLSPTGDVERSTDTGRPGRRTVVMTAVAFLLLAVLQNQDLLLAKALLADGQAAQFAVLSALGGAAAFATATIPMVLLPEARRRRPHAVPAAAGIATAIGGAMAVAGAVAPKPLVAGLFGDRYVAVATLVAPYLAAMAMLGVARVLVAARCSSGASGRTASVVAAITVAHAGAIVWFGHDAASVARVTLGGTGLLLAAVAVPTVSPLRRAAARSDARTGSVGARVAIGLAALTAVAVVIRVIALRGIWIDEAISVQQARLPWHEMLATLQANDVHPPFFQAIMWVVVRVVGSGALALKLPSILAGMAMVPVMYITGKALYDRRTGIVAAVLASVAPFLVWYSQEARMYSLFMLLATLAVFGQVQALRRGRVVDWAIFVASTAALLWTQYFAVLPVAVQQLAFVGALWQRRHDRRERRRVFLGWLLCVIAIAALVAPLVPFAEGQLDAYIERRGSTSVPSQAGTNVSPSSGQLSAYAAIANGVWAVWGYHADRVMAEIVALWPLGMLVALLALGRRRSGGSLLLAALVVVPMAALFVAGSQKRDLFELRYFSGAAPALLLLGARAVTTLGKARTGAVSLAAFATVSLGVGLVDQQLNGANPRRYDFEGALARIERTATNEDVILYEPDYLAAVIRYYAPDLRARPVGNATRVSAKTRRVYVVATDRVANSKAASARVGSLLSQLERDRRQIDRFRKPNVRVWVLQ
jgi:hypothetical protein